MTELRTEPIGLIFQLAAPITRKYYLPCLLEQTLQPWYV